MSVKETMKGCHSCGEYNFNTGVCKKHNIITVKYPQYACPDWIKDPEITLKSITVNEV